MEIFRRVEIWMAMGMLLLSNIFMTFAWYGHLKYKSKPLLIVIGVSWLIAFFEYCLQVPANRIGSDVATAAQLKVIQEVITFAVFAVFSAYYLGQRPTINDYVAFTLVVGAVGISLFQPFA